MKRSTPCSTSLYRAAGREGGDPGRPRARCISYRCRNVSSTTGTGEYSCCLPKSVCVSAATLVQSRHYCGVLIEGGWRCESCLDLECLLWETHVRVGLCQGSGHLKLVNLLHYEGAGQSRSGWKPFLAANTPAGQFRPAQKTRSDIPYLGVLMGHAV
jgi:hypothetical protein